MSGLVQAVLVLLEALIEKEGPEVIQLVQDWLSGKARKADGSPAQRVEDILPEKSASDDSVK